MADSGTAIEKRSNQQLDRADSGASHADVIPVEVVSSEEVALTRDVHARRAELAGRVLSLLSNIGNLALTVIEQRASATPSSISDRAVNQTIADATSFSPSQPVSGRQASRGGRAGRGVGRRRRRRRGGM